MSSPYKATGMLVFLSPLMIVFFFVRRALAYYVLIIAEKQ